MKTTELFEKHFGNTAFVDFDHPNIEAFLGELNDSCLAEDVEFTQPRNGKTRASYLNRRNGRRFLLGEYSTRVKAERLGLARLKTLLRNPPSEFSRFIKS